MRIKALVSCGLEVGSLVKGHEHDVSDSLGAELVRIGYAEQVKPAPASTQTQTQTPPATNPPAGTTTKPDSKPDNKAVKHADK